jgi:uncharacterized coiled-coil protein SlyX
MSKKGCDNECPHMIERLKSDHDALLDRIAERDAAVHELNKILAWQKLGIEQRDKRIAKLEQQVSDADLLDTGLPPQVLADGERGTNPPAPPSGMPTYHIERCISAYMADAVESAEEVTANAAREELAALKAEIERLEKRIKLDICEDPESCPLFESEKNYRDAKAELASERERSEK